MSKYRWYVSRKDETPKVIRNYKHVTILYRFIVRNPAMFAGRTLTIHKNHQEFVYLTYDEIAERSKLQLKEYDERRYLNQLEITQRFHLFYHVTPVINIPNILSKGIIAQVGPRAQLLGEPTDAVFLFNTLDEAKVTLNNNKDLTNEWGIIEIRLDVRHPKFAHQPHSNESIMFNNIYPNKIKNTYIGDEINGSKSC